MEHGKITRAEAEELFIEEAALLDTWQLRAWLELLTPDATYLVPSLDTPNAERGQALFLVSDDRVRIESRVSQLLGRTAWAENPRSRTRRIVSNVSMLESDGDSGSVTANFAIWRFANQRTDVYVGRYVHQLRRLDGRLRIQERKAILDLEVLRPHGKLSFIL